jgi:hypothetical protein
MSASRQLKVSFSAPAGRRSAPLQESSCEPRSQCPDCCPSGAGSRGVGGAGISPGTAGGPWRIARRCGRLPSVAGGKSGGIAQRCDPVTARWCSTPGVLEEAERREQKLLINIVNLVPTAYTGFLLFPNTHNTGLRQLCKGCGPWGGAIRRAPAGGRLHTSESRDRW